MSNEQMYVSLHNHTFSSIQDCLIDPKELFKRVKELGQSAVAITDHGSLGAVWDAYNASKKTGVKLIVGTELYFVNDLNNLTEKFSHLILLAKNHTGYKNLLKIQEKSFENAVIMFKRNYPRVSWDILEQHSEGVICTTACANGIVGQLISNKKMDEAREVVKRLQSIYGDNLAIEVQATYLKRMASNYSAEIDQHAINLKLRELAREFNIRPIVTTNAHYLTKEQAEAHDCLLAIGSGQPVTSMSRLKYSGTEGVLSEFYLKTEDEIKATLTRQFGRKDPEFVNECIANTKYFADLCEEPNWVDLKFTNPSGKELPEFDVKSQEDYVDFQEWLKTCDINLPEDSLYLRYVTYREFNKWLETPKANGINKQEYIDRIEKELDVLHRCGVSSYMLIVADYINWCKKNDVPTGPGRGCNSGDTLVFTDNGFKKLEDVNIGEFVYSHTGELRKVLNKFEYDIDEECLEVKTNYAFNSISMTKDHKVFAAKAVETDAFKNCKSETTRSKLKRYDHFEEPTWVKASELTDLHFLYMPKINRHVHNNNPWSDGCKIDLSKYVTKKKHLFNILHDKIEIKDFNNSSLTVRGLAKELNVDRSSVKTYLSKTSECKTKSLKKIDDWFKYNKFSIDDFTNSYKVKITSRFININNDFFYFIGRWIGDGWLRSSGTDIGIAFNSNDEDGINYFLNYFQNEFGIKARAEKHATKNLIQVIFNSIPISEFLNSIFVDYKKTSNTKHLPPFFRSFSNEQLLSMINGIFDSDGHHGNSKDCIDSTSKRLITELKEALLYLGIPSSIQTRKPFMRGKYLCNESYKLGFNKFEDRNSYLCKINSIKPIHLKKVYDISVDVDTSYLTSNFATHNSVGGCIVGYYLGIHAADSIKYGLVFERFHNLLKTSYSDIDADFSKFKRHKVIEYIKEKYGADKVAGISNYNTLTPKVYARSIARTYKYGGDQKKAVQIGNALADCIPSDIKSVQKAIEEASLFREYAKPTIEGGGGYTELSRFAKDLDRTPIAVSTHAAGLVIGTRPLSDVVPLRRDKEGLVNLEYEKERTEEVGLVKMDILGLSTLDIIADTYKLIKASGKEILPFDYEDYDQKAYDLISSGNLFGVFQFGTSAGTIELCKRYGAKSIEDLATITTLARPSSAEIRSEFFDTKEGRKEVKVIHHTLERALNPTLGYALYDESLLVLSGDVSNWDYGEADGLRKLTKLKGKYPEKAEKIKNKFISDAINNKVDPASAAEIWEKVVEPYQKYSFNKSHAVLYSMISYHTAWLKAHYPLEFLVANLMLEVNSNAKTSKDNIAKIKEEIRALNVKIIPPNVNTSEMTYKIIDQNTLMTGFDALKGMGKNAIPDIIEKRPFTSFEDFMSRVDGRSCSSSSIRALAASGCFDEFGISRKKLFLYASDYKKKLSQHQKKKKVSGPFTYPWPEEKDWTISEKSALERHYIGESLIGDKVQEYNGFFTNSGMSYTKLPQVFPPPSDDLSDYEKKKYSKDITFLQGEIKSFFEFKIKKEGSKLKGETMAKVTIEDIKGNRMDITCFPEGWEKFKQQALKLTNNKYKLDVGCGIYINGKLNWYEGNLNVIFEELIRFSPPPQMPSDLEHKKVSLKPERVVDEVIDESNRNQLLEEIEDELIERGEYEDLDMELD